MACLAAVYGAESGRGTSAEIEPLLMIRPPRGVWRFMSRKACWVQRKAPVTLVSITEFQCSSSRSSKGTAGAAMPAFVEQQIQSSEPSVDVCEERRDRRGIADVAGGRMRVATSL